MAFASKKVYSLKTFQLPPITSNPLSFVVRRDENGDKDLVIGSTSGLHHLRLENGDDLKYVRALKFGICMGVVLIDRSEKIDNESSARKNGFLLGAVFSGSMERWGPNAESTLIFFRDNALSGGDLAKIEEKITCERSWGRIRKMAYSSTLNCIYLSTKTDHDFRSVYQSSSVWMLPVTYQDGNGKPCTMANRLIRSKPGNIRHMAVNDNLQLLALCDLHDDLNHTVDLHNAKTGEFLYHITKGGVQNGPKPQGHVRFPRGLVFDGPNRLYVVDETQRVQKFDLETKLCDGVVLKASFNAPESLAIIDKELFVLGLKKGGGSKGFLTICGINLA